MMTGRRVPLLELVSQGRIDHVRTLTREKCNVNEKDYWGNCAVLICVERNDDAMLEVLIQAGANLDVVDPLGTSALDLAKEFQHDKVFKLIQETLSQKKLSKEFESKTEVVNDNFDKFRFYPKGEQDCQSELQSVKHPDEEEKDPQFKKVR